MPKLGLASLCLSGASQLRVATAIIQAQAGSGSGSGSGGGGVGLDLLNYTYEESDKIVWDYYLGIQEYYGNYILKTGYSQPIISTQVTGLFSNNGSVYTIGIPGTSNPPRITDSVGTMSPNVNTVRYLFNTSVANPVTFLSVAETNNDEWPTVSIQQENTTKRLVFHWASGYYRKSVARSTTKVGNSSYPYYFELVNGRLWRVLGSNSTTELDLRSDAELDAAAAIGAAGGDPTIGAFGLWQTNVFDEKMYTDNPNVSAVVRSSGDIHIDNQTSGRPLPASTAKEDIKKVVPTNYGQYETWFMYVLKTNGDLHRFASDTGYTLADTDINDITFDINGHSFSGGRGIIGIKNDYTLRNYPSTQLAINSNPNGLNLGTNKYRLISGRFGIKYFE